MMFMRFSDFLYKSIHCGYSLSPRFSDGDIVNASVHLSVTLSPLKPLGRI